MKHIIDFSDAQKTITKLFEKEKLEFNESFMQELFMFLSKVCSYQEEEIKIRPHLLICKNINQIVKQVPNTKNVKLCHGDVIGTDMKKNLKSIVPFCNSGWLVYLNVLDDGIEYGIVRSFNGITSLSFIESIKEINEEDLDEIELDYSFVEIGVLSDYELQMHGLQGSSLIIDFRIHKENSEPFTEILCGIVKDITRDTSVNDYKNEFGHLSFNLQEILTRSFLNFMRILSQKVHGTILLIVNKEFTKIPLVEDGIWLEKPINLSRYVVAAEINNIKDNSNEMFYAFSNLLIEMLNVDGITIMNTNGEIIGYNVFLNKSSVDGIQITSGGARKRAAQALIEENHKDFVGVYFQSQDGHSFYERIN